MPHRRAAVSGRNAVQHHERVADEALAASPRDLRPILAVHRPGLPQDDGEKSRPALRRARAICCATCTIVVTARRQASTTIFSARFRARGRPRAPAGVAGESVRHRDLERRRLCRSRIELPAPALRPASAFSTGRRDRDVFGAATLLIALVCGHNRVLRVGRANRPLAFIEEKYDQLAGLPAAPKPSAPQKAKPEKPKEHGTSQPRHRRSMSQPRRRK